MASMETINEGSQPKQTNPDPAQKERRVFAGIAATIVLGLVMGGWYVEGRISAAERTTAAVATHAVAPPTVIAQPTNSAPVSPQPATVAAYSQPVTVVAVPKQEPSQAPSKDVPKASPPETWNKVDPQSGELYLQLATMGPNSTGEYLQILEAKGIHPRIAPGPSEKLYRIVLGPYADKAAIEQEQSELQAAGVEFVVARY